MAGGAGGCCGLLVLFLLLGLLIALVQWAVQHAALLLVAGLVGLALWLAIASYAERLRRERVKRRSAASLGVEAARTGLERRLTIAQEFMRLSLRALDAVPADAERVYWTPLLDDLCAEAELLRRSAHDPQAARLPDPGKHDPLTQPIVGEAVDALCSLLAACRDVAAADWPDRPERLRVLRRERTRLLVAQDAVAQRLQSA